MGHYFLDIQYLDNPVGNDGSDAAGRGNAAAAHARRHVVVGHLRGLA